MSNVLSKEMYIDDESSEVRCSYNTRLFEHIYGFFLTCPNGEDFCNVDSIL